MPDTVALSDLALAAFCPRKLYYVRTTDRTPPPEHESALEIAHAYGDVLESDGASLSDRDVAVAPETLSENLAAERERLSAWESLVEPSARDVFLAGKDVHGRVAKVLQEPLAPTIVSPGEPPPDGVWQPQAVRAVGAAKALAWEEEAPVEQAFVEYPRYGRIREVGLTTRRTAAYRRTLRSVLAMDGPPPRRGNDAKCQSCRFADTCGVRTRSLRSLL